MKRKLIIGLLFALVICAGSLTSQVPPHPNDGGGPGSGDTPVGGGASIGGGLLILLSLSAGYGSKKIYEFRRKSLDA
ncbi:MAG: hypothetical protein FJY07_02105 [Bacteroidetes bacterium]|nr:hypothetical protein [Bacteroidota bacterium]